MTVPPLPSELYVTLELRAGAWQPIEVELEGPPAERPYAGDAPIVCCLVLTSHEYPLPPKAFGEIDGVEIANEDEWDRAYFNRQKRLKKEAAGVGPVPPKAGWSEL